MARRTPLLLLVPLFMAAVAAGDERRAAAASGAKPKSAQAAAAVRKRARAVEEAERAYRAALLAAERQAVEELKAARATAMRANDLPEANAIDAEVRAAQARVDELQHPPSELRARVLRQRAYRYGHWDTPDIRAVELLPGGRVTRGGGEGGADAGLRWSVRDEGGRERLTISDGRRSIDLREDEAGNFHGRWPGDDRDVVLLPADKP